MQIKLTTSIVFDVPFTAEHVAGLVKLSALHYDGNCKMASKPDGFLARWGANLAYGPIRATFHELDICLKLLEMRFVLPDDFGGDLAIDLRRVLVLANRKFREWQAVYESAVV